MPVRRKSMGKTKQKAKPRAKARKISRLRKPDDMSLEQWQVALRKQFGAEQNFKLKNTGDEPIFSEFEVTNPEIYDQHHNNLKSTENSKY